MDSAMHPRWRRRKEVWRLTWPARAVVAIVALTVFRLSAPLLYRGLAAGRPLPDADYLVVEGWVNDRDLPHVIEIANARESLHVLVTGGPLELGSMLLEYGDYARLTAARLRAAGVAAERITAVPAPPTRKDRTYNAARALARHWRERGTAGGRLNLVTRGVHARRSARLYRKALGREFEVGVIVLPDEFDAHDWWKGSQGFRNVAYEWLALLYTQVFLLFAPEGHP